MEELRGGPSYKSPQVLEILWEGNKTGRWPACWEERGKGLARESQKANCDRAPSRCLRIKQAGVRGGPRHSLVHCTRALP